MAICPHCQTAGDSTFSPCPKGDGYFLVDDSDYHGHPTDPWLGRRLGDRFVIGSILGQGSMGHVYKGYQEKVDRFVAIKIFEISGSEDGFEGGGPGNQQRFIQEARVLAKLSHPNCVTLYDFGVNQEENFLYIAMEHVGGISMRRAVRRGLKLDAIIEIVRQILMALREAHALGIVHRDLKPENIILSYRRTSDEQIVKVLDFGIAKLLQKESSEKTVAGLLFGTPAYMSPEQCRGETDITAATDIYSLGCMIFEMVTGHLPFTADAPQKMVRLHQEAAIPPMVPRGKMRLPDGFEEFVRTCMAKNPEDRFANAPVALIAFENVVGQVGRTRQLIQGMDRLGEELVARRVSVPRDNVTGAPLDPTGERGRPPVAKLMGASKSIEVQPESRPKGGRVGDTVRGLEKVKKSTEKKKNIVAPVSGRSGLVLVALVMVLFFCALLFAVIYITISG